MLRERELRGMAPIFDLSPVWVHVSLSNHRHWLTDAAKHSDGRIAVFIDEVHQLLDAPELGEELLQVLRVLHEGRSRDEALKRISYCLAGVARPRDLVRNQLRDPFDTGTVIRLEDFTLDELAPFREDCASAGLSGELVDYIYSWTSGHPYMTFKLARDLVEQRVASSRLDRDVDKVVRATLLDQGYANENYLADARLLFESSRRFGEPALGAAIALYRRILNVKTTVREAEAKESGALLVLTGLVAGRTRDGVRVLEARNRVIRAHFGEDWIDREEVVRRLDVPLRRWLSKDRSSSELLLDRDLEAAVALAKRAGEITQEQRELLLLSIEAAESRRLNRLRSRLRVSVAVAGVCLGALMIMLAVVLKPNGDDVLGRAIALKEAVCACPDLECAEAAVQVATRAGFGQAASFGAIGGAVDQLVACLARVARKDVDLEMRKQNVEALKTAAAAPSPSPSPTQGSTSSDPVAPCPVGMVRVPAGQFRMGNPDEFGEADEHPQHFVALSGFCIDKTEVTVKAYAA